MEAVKIRGLLEKFLEGRETFVVDLKLSPGKLTVTADKPGGISLAECTEINRYLKQSLEPEGFSEKHEIEVSSPGSEHPLRDYRQFQARIGKKLRVVLAGGGEVSGRLVQADQDGFEVETPKSKRENAMPARRFAFGEIREARILYEL